MVGEPVVLRGVGGPVHPQSQQLTQLHHGAADPAGGPGDQDRLPGPYPGSTGECLVGNQVVQGHGHHLSRRELERWLARPRLPITAVTMAAWPRHLPRAGIKASPSPGNRPWHGFHNFLGILHTLPLLITPW